MKVLIAAGGTGGHIYPGIAIANMIKKEQANAQIIFIGTKNGLENDLVTKEGYKIRHIRAAGIRRVVTVQNIKNVYNNVLGMLDAKKVIKEEKPDIVIGTGGYICFPMLFIASKLKIPTIIHESNALPGITVKLLSSYVNKILVGFEEAKSKLPKAKKVIVTGNPTKIEYKNLNLTDKQELKKKLGLDENLPVVLVFGGSQGGKGINDVIKELIINKNINNYQMVFATGKKNYEEYKKDLEEKGINVQNIRSVKILPYIYNMEKMMLVSDLLVTRSGALTITEISIMGKPSILIPFPYAAENHQEFNARVLEKQTAAKMILQKDLTSKQLGDTINELIKKPELLKQMGENAKKVERKGVLDTIWQEIKIELN